MNVVLTFQRDQGLLDHACSDQKTLARHCWIMILHKPEMSNCVGILCPKRKQLQFKCWVLAFGHSRNFQKHIIIPIPSFASMWLVTLPSGKPTELLNIAIIADLPIHHWTWWLSMSLCDISRGYVTGSVGWHNTGASAFQTSRSLIRYSVNNSSRPPRCLGDGDVVIAPNNASKLQTMEIPKEIAILETIYFYKYKAYIYIIVCIIAGAIVMIITEYLYV